MKSTVTLILLTALLFTPLAQLSAAKDTKTRIEVICWKLPAP